jgi:hypothetical protein
LKYNVAIGAIAPDFTGNKNGRICQLQTRLCIAGDGLIVDEFRGLSLYIKHEAK